MARRLGATDEQFAALARSDFSGFPPGWQAALRYAEDVTPSRGHATAGTFEDLAAHWSAVQIVEITAVICIFNYFNRFAIALDIPPTK